RCDSECSPARNVHIKRTDIGTSRRGCTNPADSRRPCQAGLQNPPTLPTSEVRQEQRPWHRARLRERPTLLAARTHRRRVSSTVHLPLRARPLRLAPAALLLRLCPPQTPPSAIPCLRGGPRDRQPAAFLSFSRC